MASRYVPEKAPFLNEIMFDAVLPRLTAEAEKIAGRAKGAAMARVGRNKDKRDPAYVDTIGVLGVETVSFGGGPRSAVIVGTTSPYGRKLEQKYAFISRAGGATMRFPASGIG